MKNIEEFLGDIRTMAIAGHIRPDGDAVGSCMALYLYVRIWHPEIQADVFLDHPTPVFGHIPQIQDVRMTDPDPDRVYDLFVTCDVSTPDRIPLARANYDKALHTVCIDHHVSNTGFAQVNHICGDISSCCEVLYGLMDRDRVTLPIATALYTGMVHDTGVFQYPSTTGDTLRIAAALIETGVDFSRIIEESFYQKTYLQNQILGRVLTESILMMDGKCIVGFLKRRDMIFYGVKGQDLDGIVAQLRLTKGVEAAIFLYEYEPQRFKVSLRSAGKVNVNRVAVWFGGGGHVRAAGCELSGTIYDVINNVTERLELEMRDNCSEQAE